MRKSILLLIDNLGSGGAQNQLTLLAVALKERDYRIEVFTYFPQDFYTHRLEEAQIKVHHHAKRGKLGVSVVHALRRLYETNKYDVVISFLSTPNIYGILARKLSSHTPKTIISYRSMTQFEQLSFMKLKVLEWINRSADYIVANSIHERVRWQKKYPGQADKWRTIYNAVDAKQFFPMPLKIRSNHFLVVGSVSKYKNGLLILEAMNILKAQNIEINILWVGRKDYSLSESRDYIDLMERKINDYKLDKQFKWRNPIHNIESLYRTYKFLILASKTEGLPNVVCESLACGMPCIVSDILDHPNIIKHENNGFLFNPDSPHDLAKTIRRCVDLSKTEYKRMCDHAYSNAKNMFSRNSFVQSYINLIEK